MTKERTLTDPGIHQEEDTPTGESVISVAEVDRPMGSGREHGTFMGLALDELRKAGKTTGLELRHDLDEFIVVPRGSFFKKAPAKEDILRWSKHQLQRPITDITPPPLAKVALKCFRDLQRIMGDRKYGSGKRARELGSRALDYETIQYSLSMGLQHPLLRDELYLQAFKQTTNNPSWTSCLRGWEVMCVYSTAFPPSKHVIPAFLDVISQYRLDLSIAEREQVFAHATKPTDDPKVAKERIGLMERFIRTRIEKLARTGPRGHLPTVEEIENTITLPFRHQIFGVTLEEIMEYPENRDETGNYPRILAFLAESVLKLKGTSTEGIFRVPGFIEEVQMLRLRLERGEYSLEGIADPSTPASLFKLWLRELSEPVVPASYYERCLMVGSNIEEAIAILDDLPKINHNVLKYLVKFLQVVGDPRFQPKTKMSIGNLAMVFAPNILRCPSDNPLVILANSKFEQSFLKTLINYLAD